MPRLAPHRAVLAALLLLAGPASAEEAPPVLPGLGVCRADAERLCPDVPQAGGALARCLREHQEELSGVCRERLDARGRRASRVRDACSADADKLCADVEPGQGATVRCLREHESELSERCRSALPARRGP
jgi:hypothetical protein